MSLQDRIVNQFADSIQVRQQALDGLLALIEYAAQRMVAALLHDRKILVCGNGRSACTAQLLASALLDQYERDRPSLPVISLNADAVALTAIANNGQFDDVYAKPLRALGQAGDLLVVFTDSDRVANIAPAISAAHDKEMSIIALTGDHGDRIAPLLNETDLELRVPSSSSARIQETHVLITHCLCDLIDQQLFG